MIKHFINKKINENNKIKINSKRIGDNISDNSTSYCRTYMYHRIIVLKFLFVKRFRIIVNWKKY